ncbi:hypothetical protein J3R83DRAFT_5842 [Lanmaoa asiatica]|nr:hypothetical protein J3R83DRAFT_5842 [Lanmaoa asiatica]
MCDREAGLGKIFYLSENMLLAYNALSFSLNVLVTVLIAARLYWHQVQLERVFGPRMESPYTSIATMLIESAALYGAWSLMFLILCVLRNPGQAIILAMMPQIQVIAPLLIVLWIARGKAWNHGKSFDEDETPDQLPSSGIARFSFGSRPTRVAGELSVDDANTSRNASWSTVAGGGGTEHGDAYVNVIELGLYGSEPSSIIDDIRA